MAQKLNKWGQDMEQIKAVARPIWDEFLQTFQISESEANNHDWDFDTFVEEIALELRA